MGIQWDSIFLGEPSISFKIKYVKTLHDAKRTTSFLSVKVVHTLFSGCPTIVE